jgi:hypothetical protein
MRRTPSKAVDYATADLMAAVEALLDTSEVMPADLSEVFGSLGELLRRVDHLAATLDASYDRLPAGLRCDNGNDPTETITMLHLRIGDIRVHIDHADHALREAHNLAARLAIT